MDFILSIVRALYNFKPGLDNAICKYSATATIVNRSRSTGVTRSTSRRYCRYKEEQKRGKLGKKKNYIVIIEAGKNPFIRLLGRELGRGSIMSRKVHGYSLYGGQDVGYKAPSL